MRLTCTPLFDRVLIERAKTEDRKTLGGIIMPGAQQATPTYGAVIAVGQGKRTETGAFIPPVVAIGDVVLFGKWSGNLVDEETFGPDILVMREDEILGIVKKVD